MNKDQVNMVLAELVPDVDVVMVTWKYNRSQFTHTEFGVVVPTPGDTLAVNDRPISGSDGKALAPVVHLQKVMLEETPTHTPVPEWCYNRYPVIGFHVGGNTYYWSRGLSSIKEVKDLVEQGWTLTEPGTVHRYPAVPVAAAPMAMVANDEFDDDDV